MKRDSVLIVIAIVAGFLGGSASSRLFNSAVVEASTPNNETFDTVTARNIVVTGSVVIKSTSTLAQLVPHPFVIEDALGNAVSLNYIGSQGYSLSFNPPTAGHTGFPAVLLSNNGLWLVRPDPKGAPDAFSAQLSPSSLALTYKTNNGTASTSVNSNSTMLNFRDANPSDLVDVTTNMDGYSYFGHGVDIAINKFGVIYSLNGKPSKWP
jgi:hypothetical protein